MLLQSPSPAFMVPRSLSSQDTANQVLQYCGAFRLLLRSLSGLQGPCPDQYRVLSHTGTRWNMLRLCLPVMEVKQPAASDGTQHNGSALCLAPTGLCHFVLSSRTCDFRIQQGEVRYTLVRNTPLSSRERLLTFFSEN